MDIEKHLNKCPLDSTITLFKNKWVIYILRDLFIGKSRFIDFVKATPGLSNKQLSTILIDMQNNNLIVKNNYPGNNIAYELTNKGKSLNLILYAIAVFTIENNKTTIDENILIEYLGNVLL